MVFYSLVSLLCHFGPICPNYTTARSLLKLSSVKSSMFDCVSLFSQLLSFVMSLIFILPCHIFCSLLDFLDILISHSLSPTVHLPSPVVSLFVPADCGAFCALPPSSPGTTPGVHWCSSPLLLALLHFHLHRRSRSLPPVLRRWSACLLREKRMNIHIMNQFHFK